MSYTDHLIAHARITVLKILHDAPGFRANDSVLASAVYAMGLPVTRDQLRTQIGWLAEQGLVSITRPIETVTVAEITERGCDVAQGRAFVEGVQRPSPGA